MTAPDRPRVDLRDLTHAQQDRLLGLQVLVAGGVPDLVVAVTRRVRGRRGVQTGPAVVSLVLAATLPPVGRRAVRWALRRGGRTAVVVLLALGVATVVVPFAAAGTQRTVVGSGNPLASVGWSATLRAVASLATIVQVVRTLPATRARLADERLSAG